MKKTLRHAKELDGVRGLAALSVFAKHIFFAYGATSPLGLTMVRLKDLGALGVDVFFVLSGFLITSLLLVDIDNTFYFRNFYWKRALRILPVYFLYLVLAWFFTEESHGYVLLGLAFIANFAPIFGVDYIGPAWTLSIEEQFYLVWPQIVRRVSLENLYRICLAVLFFTSARRTAVLLITHGAAIYHTWNHLDGLAIGGLLACQWIGEGAGQTPGVRRVLAFFNGRTALAIVIAWQACFVFGFSNSLGLAIFPTSYLTYRVIAYVMAYPGSKWLGWLGAAPLVFLGNISYAVYLLHMVFGEICSKWLAGYQGRNVLFVVVVAALTLVSSVLVRYAIELPVQRLRRFVLRPRQPSTEVPGTDQFDHYQSPRNG